MSLRKKAAPAKEAAYKLRATAVYRPRPVNYDLRRRSRYAMPPATTLTNAIDDGSGTADDEIVYDKLPVDEVAI